MGLFLSLIFLIVFFIIFLFSLCFLVFLFVSMFLDAPFLRTRKEILEQIFQALQLKDGSILYDLGCGDGRVLGYCASKDKGIHGVGVEKNFLPYFLARFY